MPQFAAPEPPPWLEEYKEANRALLKADPEFGRWLEEEYVPLGGGWQY